MKKTAFIFPGQGAQYVGMGLDFYENFSVAKETFQEADEQLNRNLSQLIFKGNESELTATHNSQVAIYVTSVAILRTLQKESPFHVPSLTAGLSLGEYTALTAAGFLSFNEGLQIVQLRGRLMSEACERTKGTMAVVLGLDADQVREEIQKAQMPDELWVANFNCPGQIVISGTLNGIQKGTELVKEAGAKRVLPLSVHGAFHSGLMKFAENEIRQPIQELELKESKIPVIMNYTAEPTTNISTIRSNLVSQITGSVLWEQSVRLMKNEGIELFIEIGCGKTLAGFNKRIDPTMTTLSIEKVEDLANMEQVVNG